MCYHEALHEGQLGHIAAASRRYNPAVLRARLSRRVLTMTEMPPLSLFSQLTGYQRSTKGSTDAPTPFQPTAYPSLRKCRVRLGSMDRLGADTTSRMHVSHRGHAAIITSQGWSCGGHILGAPRGLIGLYTTACAGL